MSNLFQTKQGSHTTVFLALSSQQPPHPAARGHHNSIPLATTSRKKSLKSFKNVTYDMPPMTSYGAEGE